MCGVWRGGRYSAGIGVRRMSAMCSNKHQLFAPCKWRMWPSSQWYVANSASCQCAGDSVMACRGMLSGRQQRILALSGARRYRRHVARRGIGMPRRHGLGGGGGVSGVGIISAVAWLQPGGAARQCIRHVNKQAAARGMSYGGQWPAHHVAARRRGIVAAASRLWPAVWRRDWRFSRRGIMA